MVQFYYDEFYKACHRFTYREMLALSRLLGCNLRTVYRWKNKEKFPRDIETLLVVMGWTKQGKPIKLETQVEIVDKNTMW